MDFLGTMDSKLLVLIIGVLFVGASVLSGWMLFYVMRSRKKRTPRRPGASSPSSPTAPPPTTTEKVPAKPGEEEAEPPQQEQLATLSGIGRRASAAPVEVLRLLRDRVTGALIVEVEGEEYRALAEIKDGRAGRQVLQAAADLVRFTEVIQPQDQARTPQLFSPSATEPKPIASPPAPSTLVLKVAPALEQEPPVQRTPAPPSVEREFLQSLIQQGRPKEKEAEKPSLSPIEFFRRSFAARRAARVQDTLPSPRSFVEEIEEILQRFLHTYPSFIGKEVHVGTSPGGGIHIRVGKEFYDTPDDIPDPEIRGIIKAAIQEWERS